MQQRSLIHNDLIMSQLSWTDQMSVHVGEIQRLMEKQNIRLQRDRAIIGDSDCTNGNFGNLSKRADEW